MSLLTRIRRSNFVIKLFNWEYWPFGILQGPVFIYWLWLALKARSLFFFSASNPGILSGGMLGESKSQVLEQVPDEVKPRTILFKPGQTKQEILDVLAQNGLDLPVIFKPDVGERGWMVRRISTPQDIDRYLADIRIDFIAQELVNLPFEFGVFYMRHPDSANGQVTSIAMKEFLAVMGDGAKTLRQLILMQDRAKLQWESLQRVYHHEIDRVLAPGEKKELVSIGNHCLGTKFLNGNHLITPAMNASFDRISKSIPGFYFGRYDLRCASLEDLERGKVSIVELNGCGAEPAHIYQPGFSFWKAMGVLFTHVHNMYRVSIANHRKGVPYLPFREGREIYRRFKSIRSTS